jgi:hypothetical protein
MMKCVCWEHQKKLPLHRRVRTKDEVGYLQRLKVDVVMSSRDQLMVAERVNGINTHERTCHFVPKLQGTAFNGLESLPSC